MSKVEAWQCKHCTSLSATKNLMEKCRRQCAKMIKERLAYEKKIASADKLANTMRLEVDDINEVPRYIEKYVKDRFGRTITIETFDVQFKTDMAAIHDAPIGKKHEWSVPKGQERTRYKGWDGRISGEQYELYKDEIKCESASFGRVSGISDLSRIIRGFHTGNGSGGSKFGYSVRLYLDDVPPIEEENVKRRK